MILLSIWFTAATATVEQSLSHCQTGGVLEATIGSTGDFEQRR